MKKTVRFNNSVIEYSDEGKGEALVLLHGYLESGEVWDDFTRDLSVRYRTIAIDLPGHGNSSVYSSEHTMEFMAEAVKAVMDAEGIGKAMLTGHSLGGYVTLAFVEQYPSRLHAYCLFHSHPFADTDEVIANRKREIKVVESGKKDLIYPVNIPKMFAGFNKERFKNQIERFKDIASRIPDRGIIAVLKGMIKRPSRSHILESGSIPLLFIAGVYDNYIPYDEVKKRISLPDNAEMLVLQESGHIGFVEEKEKSLEAMVSFYGRVLNKTC